MNCRTIDIYWADDHIKTLMNKFKADSIDIDELKLLVSELDRRLIQLWDKVTFENKHCLVDYSNFKRQSNDT